MRSNVLHAVNARLSIREKILWIEYEDNDVPVFWDVLAFRPCIRGKLKPDTTYDAIVLLDRENLFNGEIVEFPRELVVLGERDAVSFTNIR